MSALRVIGVALALAIATAESPHFAPVEKSSIVKTLSSDTKAHSTTMTMSMDGKELPKEFTGDMSISMHEHKKIVLTDRYVKVGDGRPLELDRTYDELVSTTHEENAMPGQPKAVEKDKTEASDLEGATVRFSWKEAKDAYEKTFAGEDRDAALLEDLREDIDFRELLPQGEVKAEDKWDLEPAAFRQMFGAGGTLHFHEQKKPIKKTKERSLDNQLGDNLSGKGQATYESVREKEGRRLAVIAIEADLETTAKDPEADLDCKLTMKVEGHVLWDLAANRVESVDLTGQMTMDMSGQQKSSKGGKDHTIDMHFVLEGEVRLELTTKAP